MGYTKLPPSSGGSGAVDSVFSRIGNVVASSGDYTAQKITVTPAGNISSTDVQAALEEISAPLTGTPSKLAYYTTAGDLSPMSGLGVSENISGLRLDSTVQPDDNGGQILHNVNLTLDPISNSPTEAWTVRNASVLYDPNSSGFSMGTGGTAFIVDNMYITNTGTGSLGQSNFINMGYNIGNGTDPITVKGIAYSLGFGGINANVTVDGAIQGYIFQPNVNASATFTPNSYITAFADGANVPTNLAAGYLSANLSPIIGSIPNNNGYTGVNVNPNITTFNGNSNANAIGIAGTYGTFGTGGFVGVNVNPTITSANYATGIDINMNNSTATTVRAANFTGDVSINGALSFTGALSIGKLTAYASQAVVDGGGTPTTIHTLVSSPTVADNSTIANIDTIGVNTASLITIGANCTLTSGGFGLGLASLALPSLVQIGAGSTLDYVSGAVFAVNMAGGSGTINQAKGARAVFIGDGTTTVNRYYAVSAEYLGLGATENWGVHAASPEYNFMQSLKIGGSEGSTDKVTGPSNGLEFAPTKALVVTNVTNAEEAALTAVNGMIVYNTDTNKLRGYENGAWVNLV